MTIITADRLLAGIKRRNSLTENDRLLDDEDLLAFCDDIIKAHIVPLLIATRGEYLVTYADEPAVANQAIYDFPARAVGLTLRDIKLRRVGNPTEVRELREIPIEQESSYRGSSGQPFGYYFRGDQIVIVDAPSSSDWVFELWNDQHPSNLVKLDQAAVVSAVNGDIVTVDSLPDVLTIGTEIDFIRRKPGHRIMAMDKAIQNVTGSDLTFAPGMVPEGLAVGDFISAAGTTPVLQVSALLHPALETIVSKRAMYSAGDFEARDQLTDDEKAELKNASVVLEPRNRGEAVKMVNRGGLLRGRGLRRGGRYG